MRCCSSAKLHLEVILRPCVLDAIKYIIEFKRPGYTRRSLPVTLRSLAAAQFDCLLNIPQDCTKSPLLIQFFSARKEIEESNR